MPAPTPSYSWERFPEYIAANQYARCAGRIMASLPRRHRRAAGRTFIQAAVLIGKGIAGAHAEDVPEDELPREQRALYRSVGLTSIEVSRFMLLEWKKTGVGEQASVLAALELLERVESGLRERPLPDGSARRSAGS